MQRQKVHVLVHFFLLVNDQLPSARCVRTARSATRDFSIQHAIHTMRSIFSFPRTAQSLFINDVHSGPLRTSNAGPEAGKARIFRLRSTYLVAAWLIHSQRLEINMASRPTSYPPPLWPSWPSMPGCLPRVTPHIGLTLILSPNP